MTARGHDSALLLQAYDNHRTCGVLVAVAADTTGQPVQLVGLDKSEAAGLFMDRCITVRAVSGGDQCCFQLQPH